MENLYVDLWVQTILSQLQTDRTVSSSPQEFGLSRFDLPSTGVWTLCTLKGRCCNILPEFLWEGTQDSISFLLFKWKQSLCNFINVFIFNNLLLFSADEHFYWLSAASVHVLLVSLRQQNIRWLICLSAVEN